MRTIRQTFQGVTVRREVKTFCPKCKKKMKRVLSDTYFRNGFHDEAVTDAKYRAAQAKEAAKMEKKGVLCSKCDATTD